MAFSKITNAALNSRGATILPNQPTISATALKQEFDAPAKNIIAPAFNNLIDELEATTAATSIGATTPPNRAGTTVQGVMNSISSDLDAVISDVSGLEGEAHSHPNKEVIDELTDESGQLYYNGSPIGETDYDDLDNRPQINGYTLSGNMSTSDLGITIPDELSDLSDDSDHRTVSDSEKTTWNGKISNGFKSVVVGTSTLIASGEDVLTLKAGDNVTLTPNTSDNSVEIKSTGGGGGGGSANWGSIGGTLSNQTDLQTELDSKQDTLTAGDGIDITTNIVSVDLGDGLTIASGKVVPNVGDGLTTNASGKIVPDVGTTVEVNSTTKKLEVVAQNTYSSSDTKPISGQGVAAAIADKAEDDDLDDFTTSLVAYADGTAVKVAFDNLNPNYGYKIFFDDKNQPWPSPLPSQLGDPVKSAGTTTGTIKLTYTLSNAVAGQHYFSLRIFK